MRRTQTVIAIVVVATALCAADRAAVAAVPQVKPQSQGLARSLAARLTSSLRQSVSPARMQPLRAQEKAQPFPLVVREAASGVRSEFSPFQFRLPPPAR